MNSKLSVAGGILVTLAVGAFVYWHVHAARAQIAERQSSGTGGMSAADIASHANASSCWSIINGGVYDLTSWIPQHPGGQQAILQL